MQRGGLEQDYLIGIDFGTQSLRGLLIDRQARRRLVASRPTPTVRRQPNRAEYEPEAIWQTTLVILRELAAQIPAGHAVAGLAVASVGESCVLLDAKDDVLGNALAWFDRRTESDASLLAERIGLDRLAGVTGLAPDCIYTLYKLLWTRRVEPARFSAVRRMLNIADWLAFRLSGEAATDFSLASRTGCLDLLARRWSAELLGEAGLDPDLFPAIRPSGTLLGPVRSTVLAETGLAGSPVVGVGAHDHICGAFAAGALVKGVLLDSMGTAEAIFAVRDRPSPAVEIARNGYSQGAVERDRPLFYVLGTINSSGGALAWLRDLFGGACYEDLIEAAARVSLGSNGVSFLPHLASGGPPCIDPVSRGAFLGLTAAKGRGEIFRAALEGLAMEARNVADGMQALAGASAAESIVVTGGNIRNAVFLEIKASVYCRPITVIAEPEATALGAALLGGVAAGIWRRLEHALMDVERQQFVVDPRPDWVAAYEDLFRSVHARLHTTLRPLHSELTKREANEAAS